MRYAQGWTLNSPKYVLRLTPLLSKLAYYINTHYRLKSTRDSCTEFMKLIDWYAQKVLREHIPDRTYNNQKEYTLYVRY